jgi:hypothetical protein
MSQGDWGQVHRLVLLHEANVFVPVPGRLLGCFHIASEVESCFLGLSAGAGEQKAIFSSSALSKSFPLFILGWGLQIFP